MTRWLLAPLALACLLAGLLPLGVAAMAAFQGLSAGLRDPVLAPTLHDAVLLAAAAALPGAALGLAGASSLRHAGGTTRAVLLACAVAILALPPAALTSLPTSPHIAPRDWEGFGSAAARAAALLLLVTARAMRRLDPGLRRAALLAGARPLQAWRHAVLGPILPSATLGVTLAFLAALAQTRAGAVLAPHLDLAEAWALPAALLLTACGAVALAGLLRTTPGGDAAGV